jgi:hypothetical protein
MMSLVIQSPPRRSSRRWQIRVLVVISLLGLVPAVVRAEIPCRIEVRDGDSGWPVSLVELRTTHGVRFVTDNAGVIACDAPELYGQEVWFGVHSPGYEVSADGFGYRGVRLTPQPGQTLKVEVRRTSIARRLGRLTGAGLFAESQKLGEMGDWKDAPVFGCDSIQNAVHRGKMYWAWGDTTIASYPLGIFEMTTATTRLRPFESFAPPVKPAFDYLLDERGRPRAAARIPGDGPSWLTGYVSLPDAQGEEHLVATYRKIEPPLDVYETGLCVWDDEKQLFEPLKTTWRKQDGGEPDPLVVDGHPAFWTDEEGQRWVLFGNPLPRVRVQASFEDWQQPSRWERLTPQSHLKAAGTGDNIEPHSGSIAWNPYRQRWVTVFMQKFGDSSVFGELWYAEADSPTGPWGPCVKVLSHDNYTFYNPRLHPEFTPEDSPILLFEGTYTQQFTKNAEPTPRYDYNQILYRLDLDDPQLQGAQAPAIK